MIRTRLVCAQATAAVAGVWLAFTLSAANAAILTTDISFQNGTNGYSSGVERRIGPGYSQVNGTAINSDTANFYVDGGDAALNDTGFSNVLLRFDNIVGGVGIPAGAKVISANVELKTTSVAAANVSDAAYNLYALNTPFDSTTVHNDAAYAVGGNGVRGNVSAITGSFDGMSTQGSVVQARADRAVQSWVNGGTNYGVAVASDRSTDAWSFHTSGSATAANHPKLNVTYTTDPNVAINSYAPNRDSFPNGNGGGSVGTIVDGSTVAEGFVDGNNGTDSFDQPYLVKFGNLNLNYSEIVKAELVLVSGFSSANADTTQPWTVHRMLRDWDGTTTYANLDTDSNPALNEAAELVAGGAIAPAAYTLANANDTEVVHMDVTSIVEAWRAGAPNFGIYVGAVLGSTNGWQFFTSGAPDASLRPELRIIGVVVPEPAPMVLLVGGAIVFVARRSRRGGF